MRLTALFVLFMLCCHQVAMGQKVVIDKNLIAQIRQQYQNFGKYIDIFNDYMNDFDAAVRAYGEKELGLSDLNSLLEQELSMNAANDGMCSITGGNNGAPPQGNGYGDFIPASADFSIPPWVLNQGGKVASEAAIDKIADILYKNGVPYSVSKAISVYGINIAKNQLNRIAAWLRCKRAQQKSLWDGYVFSGLSASEYFDLRNQYMQSAYDRKKSIFDDATMELQNSQAILQDIQKDLDAVPEVKTSLQQSLQLVNKQLARLVMQNSTLAKLYAEKYMEENEMRVIELKQKYEDDKIDAYYDDIYRESMNRSAEDLHLSKDFLLNRNPDTSAETSTSSNGGNRVPIFIYRPN